MACEEPIVSEAFDWDIAKLVARPTLVPHKIREQAVAAFARAGEPNLRPADLEWRKLGEIYAARFKELFYAGSAV